MKACGLDAKALKFQLSIRNHRLILTRWTCYGEAFSLKKIFSHCDKYFSLYSNISEKSQAYVNTKDMLWRSFFLKENFQPL